MVQPVRRSLTARTDIVSDGDSHKFVRARRGFVRTFVIMCSVRFSPCAVINLCGTVIV